MRHDFRRVLQAARTFPILDVVACADVMMDRAKEKAEEFGAKAVSNEAIYADPEVDIVINLSPPLTGVIEFQSGVLATVITSFEAYGHTHPCIEVYGDQGSMTCPDPNSFGGPVKVLRNGDTREWKDVTLTHIYSANSRSLGVADMAQGILRNRPHRCNGDLARHVLDIMLSFDRAGREEKRLFRRICGSISSLGDA